MTGTERYLLHQIHPAKLATDIAASLISSVLFWHRRLVWALAAALVPSGIASAMLLRSNLETYRSCRAGVYVLEHMPPSMQAIRAASAVVTAVGAWNRSPKLIAAGYVLTLIGWSHGLPRRLERAPD